MPKAKSDFTNFIDARPNYFPGQFLLEDDFEIEQKYFIDRQRYHRQSLHISGIIEGLEVEVIKDKQEVLIKPGSGINSNGDLIILKKDTSFSQFTTLTVGELYISYREEKQVKQQEDFTRWQEVPTIAFAATTPNDGVKLAKISIVNNVPSLDLTVRSYSGIFLPNATGNDLTLRSGGNANPNVAILNGSLTVKGNFTVSSKLAVSGDQKIEFSDTDLTNNLKLQLWTGYGLGVNDGTLFYAANGKHSWRDTNGANERMVLTLGDNGFLTVNGTGTSSFAGNLRVTGTITGKIDAANINSGVLDAARIANNSLSADKITSGTISGNLSVTGALNADSLVLGPTNASHLGLGYHQDYSWIQSHGNKPLVINTSNNVGIGNTVNPIAKLDISSASRTDTHPTAVKGLYITGDFKADSDGVEFRHSNGTQGIGFGFNTIYATGSNANQDLSLKPKGTGEVTVSGNLKVTGTITGKIDAVNINSGVLDVARIPISAIIITGMIVMWSGDETRIPGGWALCDGQGGRPDLRGRFILGSGQGSGLTNRIRGVTGGVERHILTVAEMPTHNHGITDPGHAHTWTASRQLQGTDDRNYTSELSKGDTGSGDDMSKNTNSVTTRISIQNNGSSQSHENMPPFYVLAFIIKL